MSKARELAELIGNAGGTSEQVLSGRRNLIINGAMQVWQRGTSIASVSNGGYGADRWGCVRTASVTLSQQVCSLDDFDYAVRYAASSSGSMKMWQSVEPHPTLKSGTTLTMSFWIRASVATPNFSIGTVYNGSSNIADGVDYAVGTEWTRIEHTFTLNGDPSTMCRPYISAPSSSVVSGYWFEVTGVQLELGSVATPFEHRSYGEELALCQRYYERCGCGITGSTSSNMIAWNSSVIFKVEKRTIPTVMHLANFTGMRTGSNQHTISTSNISRVSTYGAVLVHTASGSASVSQSWLYYTNENNIAFDAEL